MLTFEQARQRVIEVVSSRRPAPVRETIELSQALGRVLAAEVRADRDYPPFDRSTRDGYAVNSADVSGAPLELEILGEIKAGDAAPRGNFLPDQCYQIWTGAPVPSGADAVVMLEHTTRPSEKKVTIERAAVRGQNVVPRGSEANAGQVLASPGVRLGYAELALLAQVGQARAEVFRRPRVAILSTGDEVVAIEGTPGPTQIRNSNSVSLAAQSRLAGAEPVALGNAPDQVDALRGLMERGLQEDVLVLSGGVSMGKYDLVEGVLRDLGAEFSFDAVAIRPGRPAVFGVCRDKFVFGLPGNPVSTMVTFELFVVPALDLLSGMQPRAVPMYRAKLAAPAKQKAALAHFLPAQVEWTTGEPVVRELLWQGSGDIVALAQSNCFLVVRPERLEMAAGEWVDVIPRRDKM